MVLDGCVSLVGIDHNAREGYLESGDFYSTELNDIRDSEFDKRYFQSSLGMFPPKLNLDS